jgi:D-glycero-D-manno-heptose 1,7-bisphosphate phosphatase
VSRRRAIFLDKDGTIIEDVPYSVDPAKIRLLPGAVQGLRLLNQAGYLLVVISNQSGVAHGYFREEAIRPAMEALRRLLAAESVPLAGMYYCPHHLAGKIPEYAIRCECRKPRPGLLRQAARELGINLATSWMIGDILDDVEAGNRAGCRSILIENGGETKWLPGEMRDPSYRALDLKQAAEFVLAGSRLTLSAEA